MKWRCSSHRVDHMQVALSVAPASFVTRIDSALFRVLLLWRLRLPLPLSICLCGCGRPLDSFGHHRAACSRAVCREAGRVIPQHDGQGHGLGCSARPRCWTVGNCRRRFATVWWHTGGHRHDFGVHVALRWLGEAWCCSQGRCSSPNNQTQKGAHLS